ncbi:MAG: helix-turn-helix domain-containing protein [Aestuariivirga sp.]
MSKAFEKIMRGLEDARAYAQGKPKAGTKVYKVKVDRTDVAALRMRQKLTQAQFAELLGTSLGTIRKWESGERSPSGAAARLIRLLEAKPKVVTDTLGIKPRAAKRQPRSPLVAAE